MNKQTTENSGTSDNLDSLVVPNDWTPINPPTPQDEEVYDICLHADDVIEGVEFWAFGGGFKPLACRINGKIVAYPLEVVRSFKLHNQRRSDVFSEVERN